tara:strand:+ start:14442 stop:15230 length:789 start_codon:yes stop_codon:yes gene_type:complete
VLVKAKKSLGQNFLIDSDVIKTIIKCSPIKGKEILEVGPGTGNLTEKIIDSKPSKVYLIEKDNFLLDQLRNKFDYNIEFLNKDILKINEKNLSKKKLTVFGNLPYNISTEILIRWIVNLDSKIWFDKLILMFQKEVAQRIMSKHNTSHYGRLSVISNWKLNIEKIIDIKPHSFRPRPRVDSSLLVFTPKTNLKKICSEDSLEKVTRTFFNQRRKKIRKPFNQLFNNSEQIANRLNINLNLRPQNLTVDMYLLISKEYDNLRS